MSEIRVLIVEDNLVVQQYLKAALATDASLSVVEVVNNGQHVLEAVQRCSPDLVLLDLFLPGMDGLEVISEVMCTHPCPIVVISGELDRKDRDLTFEAQRLGAVDVLAKPRGMSETAFKAFSESLVRTVKIMSHVKVTRRRPVAPARPLLHPALRGPVWQWDVMLIGCSTGGPAALFKVLSAIPKPFPYAILLAQHMTDGFSDSLRSWLCNTGCEVVIPEDGSEMTPNRVYLAADGKHLVLDSRQRLRQVTQPGARYFPSVDMLFESVAHHYTGRVCAMVLTGMGNDGAQALPALYQQGAYIIAEAESSSVIYSMPKAAKETGAISKEASLDEIVQFLRRRYIEAESTTAGHGDHTAAHTMQADNPGKKGEA